MIASISSLFPTPVSKQIMASLMYGIKMRFARNPGESADCEGIFPMAIQKATAVSTVDCEVCRPVIISTPFWMGTGFMKCVETTLELALVSVGSLVVDAAIRVIDMEEVFVARIACAGQICASLEKMSNFREGISGTASMTKSTSERGSMEVWGVSRERMVSASSWVMRFFETSLASNLPTKGGVRRVSGGVGDEGNGPAKERPLSIDAWLVSTNVTGTPALCAATNAIPKP